MRKKGSQMQILHAMVRDVALPSVPAPGSYQAPFPPPPALLGGFRYWILFLKEGRVPRRESRETAGSLHA